MGLLQNISMLSAEPIKNTGGAAVQCINRSSNNRPEQQLNKYFGLGGIDQKGGVPYGYSPPFSWTMPIKEGGMSAYTGVAGVSTTTTSLNMGINLTAVSVGIGAAMPTLICLAELIANTSGSGSIPPPTLQCPLCLHPATVSGQGTVSTAQATALAQCLSNIEGTGHLADSDMNLITQMAVTMSGSGHVSCALDLLIYITAQLNGAGNLTSSVELIQQLSAAISGQGNIPSSALVLLLDFAASLAGQGDVNAALTSLILLSASLLGQGVVAPDLSPLAKMAASLAGNSTVAQAHIDAMAVLVSNLRGTGTITLADIKTLTFLVADIMGSAHINAGAFGECFMNAEITQVGEMVTPQSCAQAVWAAVAAAFNDPGTMGSKMNSASAAGDPWTAEIPGTYAEGSAGAILEKIKKLVRDNQALILAK